LRFAQITLLSTYKSYDNCLNILDQIAKGKSLVESAAVSDNEDEYFIDQVQVGVCDQDMTTTLECYINLPESCNPE